MNKLKKAQIDWEIIIKETFIVLVGFVSFGETVRGNTPLTHFSAGIVYILLLTFFISSIFRNNTTGLVHQGHQEQKAFMRHWIQKFYYDLRSVQRNYIYFTAAMLVSLYVFWLLSKGASDCSTSLIQGNGIAQCFFK